MAVSSKKVAEIDYNFLQCGICFEKFTRPKVLKCLHSYCESCLERTPQQEGWITCPECRHKTRVPRGGVGNLKDNFLMNSLIDNAKVRSQLMMTKTKQPLMCNCCKKQIPAVARCLDCNRYLCKACKTAHQGLDALRHHQVASMDDMRSGKVVPRSATPRTQPTCSRHPDRKAEVYCLTCEELICKDCKPAGSKSSKHHHIDPQQAAKLKKVELQKRVPSLARVCEALLVAERQDGETKHSIEARAQLVQAQLDEAATAMHAKIDQEKRKMLAEVNDIKSARLRGLQDHKNKTSYMRKQAQNVYDVAKNAITQAPAAAFLSLYPSLDSKIQDLCDGKFRPRPIDRNPKPFAFVPNNSRDDDLQLGTIVEECREFPVRFKSACGIAACPNGDLVIADHDMDCVSVFNVAGQSKLTLQTPNPSDGIHNVTDVAVTSNETLLLVDKSHNVRVFNKEGKFLRKIATPKIGDKPDPIGRPRSVTAYQMGEKDYMIVGYHGVSALTIHNLETGSVLAKLSPAIRPGCLAVTQDNRILVSDYDAGTVVVLSLTGQRLASIDTMTQGNRLKASGVCSDGNGNLYVAVHYPDKGTAQIRQYNEAGKFLSCVAEGLQNPQNMVFTRDAVPKLAVADEDSVKLFKINY
ncbi:E3 ubiquitin-protein ligase TRIM56-like [Amphiura filiformis]|uniref:E3 ubiquitin-protein ligase TRIM56-like n=1 Tax=Amphiura filiformis TaxID=82378 RepID=UPI003B21E282